MNTWSMKKSTLFKTCTVVLSSIFFNSDFVSKDLQQFWKVFDSVSDTGSPVSHGSENTTHCNLFWCFVTIFSRFNKLWMEHRTLLLCANHFLRKLTISHQDVSFLVNVYYKRRACWLFFSWPSFFLLSFTLNQFITFLKTFKTPSSFPMHISWNQF